MTSRSSSRLGPVLMVVFSLALSACSATAQPSGSSEPAPSATLRTSTPVPLRTPTPATPQPTFTPDAFTKQVLDATGGASPAGSDLDRLWADVFAKISVDGAMPYAPPAAVLGYRSGDVPDTACAGSAGPARWINNAFYCRADHRIMYDEDWLRRIAEKNGEFTTLAILAHEWGHHVQWLMGGTAQDIGWELQADCMAGMYLSTSSLLPHTSVADEDGAMVAALTTMFSLGDPDYTASEWFRAFEHGSPVQRITSISTGLQSNQEILNKTGSMASGLPFCYGYRDFKPGAFATVGPYQFLVPPGQQTSTTGDVFTVEPETRTNQPGSRLLMHWIPDLPLAGGATAEQIAALWKADGPQVHVVGGPFEIAGSHKGSKGVARLYERVVTDESGSQTTESGLFGLVTGKDDQGGLVIQVVRHEPLPSDPPTSEGLATIEEELITMFQATGRLCTPDESSDKTAPDFSPVCLADQ